MADSRLQENEVESCLAEGLDEPTELRGYPALPVYSHDQVVVRLHCLAIASFPSISLILIDESVLEFVEQLLIV